MGFLRKNKADGNRSRRPDEYAISDNLKVIFNSKGLVPVIIQHQKTSEVLRFGYLDRWALEMSLNDRKVYLFRRSLQRVEAMGEEDDNEYKISSIKLGRYYRCLLFKVNPTNPQKADSNFIHSIDE